MSGRRCAVGCSIGLTARAPGARSWPSDLSVGILCPVSGPYRDYAIDQPYLLPPSPRDWLPEDHPALFVADVVSRLDLSEFYGADEDDDLEQPPYSP
jgi:hypothetical protein